MPISDLLASITGDQHSISTAHVSIPPKRKADNELGPGTEKMAKKDHVTTAGIRSVVPLNRSISATATINKLKPLVAVNESSKTAPPISPRMALPIVDAGSTKPPKKGSFAEIMARAKVAQSTFGQVGKIQHKPIEKGPSKRDRAETKSQVTGKQKPMGDKSRSSTQQPVRNGVSYPVDAKGKTIAGKASQNGIPPEKKIKKAASATTGYAGTARPIASSKTSLKSSTSGKGMSNGNRSRTNEYGRKYTYASGIEDDEDEDDEEAEEDYYSDASSDMEAAAFEVDEEEERATRIARKEDALALEEENRLKRDKEEKRRRLTAMAKARR